jgi:hypothetical protein
MTLTPTQRTALQTILYYQLKLWDAGGHAETLFEQDIDTHSSNIDYLCSAIDGADDAFKVTDEDLIEVFELEEPTK